MRAHVHRVHLPATGIKPAEFPVGSLESRAAARSLLEHRDALSDDDLDALVLHGGVVYLGGPMKPNHQDLELTAIYRRGRELHEKRFGPVIPAHEDLSLQRATSASLQFERVFGREPHIGDVLHYEDVARKYGPDANEMTYGPFIEAWERQLPVMPCPLKLESGKLFYRTVLDAGERWEEEVSVQPQNIWRVVEMDALGTHSDRLPSGPTPSIDAVEFLAGC